MKNKKRLLKVILISTFILLFVYLIAEKNIFNKQNVIDLFTASEKGAHFKVFFMAITTLFVIFFVPISWFTALAAFFFGFKGFLYVISSGITACIIAFYIGRIFQKDVMKFVYKIYNRKKRKISLDEVTKKIEKYGMGYVFFLRSMPFIPCSVVNYVSGFTSIDFKDYFLGTILGMGPGLMITTYFFTKAVSFREDPMGAIGAAAIKVIYFVAVLLWQKNSKYKAKE